MSKRGVFYEQGLRQLLWYRCAQKFTAACFIRGRRQEVCEFGATTRELLALVDWLLEGGCPYWKPLYNILESLGLEAMVVNAQHMRAVPGRKTDVKDSEWIADLL
nr:transposase [uncultured Acetatifactor sp.]